jgi:hypothetical protein
MVPHAHELPERETVKIASDAIVNEVHGIPPIVGVTRRTEFHYNFVKPAPLDQLA